jgi:Leucine rich repeat
MNDSLQSGRITRLVVLLSAAAFLLSAGGRFAGAQPSAAPAAPQATRAAPADVAAAKQRLGEAAIYRFNNAGALTHVTIPDGADVTADDVILFSRLADLHTLHIFDCRSFNDEMIGHLTGLERLRSLAITNSGLTDAGVETLVKAFPDLVELDLSSNTNLTGTSLKLITGLEKLETLTLIQNRFNDLNTRRLSKMPQLRTLDLRGNMEAGDMTLEVIGKLPNLTALKHRSTAVTDAGLQGLAESKTLESLLMQDFVITNESGPQLAKLSKLSSGIWHRRCPRARGPAAHATDAAGPAGRRRCGADGARQAPKSQASLSP